MSNSPNQNTEADNFAAQTQKKSKLPMILGIILGLGLLGLVCCGGIIYFGFNATVAAMQAPIDEAINAISADAEIAEKLGTPIVSTSTLGVTNYQNNNGNGSAQVQFNAQGPNNSANVSGEMTLTGGSWSVKDLSVTIDDTTIMLPR